MTRRAGFLAIVGFMLAGVVFGSRTVSANGEEFFYRPAGDGPVQLVYIGLVKDTAGNPLDRVEIEVVTSGDSFKFLNNSPGHFRSPDVGVYYKTLKETLDPSAITLIATKQGYQPTTMPVPNKARGTLEVDFVMPKVGEVVASATNDTASGPAGTPSGGGGGWALLGFVLVVGEITAVAARTSGRQRSTGDSGPAAV